MGDVCFCILLRENAQEDVCFAQSNSVRTAAVSHKKEKKEMKKKLTAALMAALLTLSMLLTACGSADTTTAAPETTPAASEAVTTKSPETTPAATEAPATEAPTTEAPTTEAPVTEAATTAAPGQTITITDMTGREVTVPQPVERIVALSAADCEVLYAVGAGDMLAGRGEYCDYPAEVMAVPSVQSGYETNIEQIIALKPQVLLMSTMAQTEEQVAQLEAAGIAVVVSDAQDIEGVYQSIGIIGTLSGHEEEAQAVIKGMQDSLAELKEKAKGDGSETVYFEVSPLEYGLWTAGKGTFMNEVAGMLGLKNAFDDVEGWGEISEEQVIERDPDYIVTITMYFGEGQLPEEEIAARPGWDVITAVKNNKILRMQDNELSRPGPRIADGAKMLFGLVYGDAQ